MQTRYKWLFPFVRPYLPALAGVLLLSLLSTGLALSYPYFSSLLIDGVLINRTHSLFEIVTIAFCLMITGYLLSAMNSLWYLRITLRMLRDLRTAIVLRVERTHYAYFVRTKAGDIITRLNGDAAEVQGGLTDVVLQAIIQVSTFLFVGFMLFWLDYRLAISCMVFLPVVIASVLYFRRHVVETSGTLRVQNSLLQSFLIERLQAITIIKLLSAEQRVADDFDRKVAELNESSFRLSWITTVAEGIPRMAIIVSTLIIFAWGGYEVLSGEMTVGALVAFTGYQARIFGPVQSLAGLVLRIQRMSVSLKRLEELLMLPDEADEVNQTRHVGKGRNQAAESKSVATAATAATTNESVCDEMKAGNNPERRQAVRGDEQDKPAHPILELRQVSFAHEARRPLLRCISATLHAGEAVALTGDSGQGKSTLIHLITGLYRPSSGSIVFDEDELSCKTVEGIRKRIAVAVQQPYIFHASVLENIRFGAPHATEEEVIKAATLAGLHDEIMQLADAYETVVGERGYSLSGGQRQRLALARTLLIPADLYILDEATSEVDSATERQIYQRLREALSGRSMVIISHRVGALDWVETKWHLAHGELRVEQGALYDSAKSG